MTNFGAIESSMHKYNIMSSSKSGKPVLRIRTPHPHDVLCGRGGGINAHPGNKRFRSWVATRKEAYNLASNKQEKTVVCEQVMDLVKAQTPPGRFLAKEENEVSAPGLGFGSPTLGVAGYWIEIDYQKALAKTSQALREGAPRIRAKHGVIGGKMAHALRQQQQEQCGGMQMSSNKRQRQSLAPPMVTPASVIQQQRPNARPALNYQTTLLGNQAAMPMPNLAMMQQKRLPPSRLSSPKAALQSLASSFKSAASQHIMPPPAAVTRMGNNSKINNTCENANAHQCHVPQSSATFLPMNKNNEWQQGHSPNTLVSNQSGLVTPSSFSPTLSVDFEFPETYPEPNQDFLKSEKKTTTGLEMTKRAIGFDRSHSLATSDVGMEEYDDDHSFTDPFENDSLIGTTAESDPYTSVMNRSTNTALKNSSKKSKDSGKDIKESLIVNPPDHNGSSHRHNRNEVGENEAKTSNESCETERTGLTRSVSMSSNEAIVPPDELQRVKSVSSNFSLSNMSNFSGMSSFSNLGSHHSQSDLSKKFLENLSKESPYSALRKNERQSSDQDSLRGTIIETS